MGRKLEEVIINELASKYKKKMIGEYIPTKKNAPVKELYDKLGFVFVAENDGCKKYELDATKYNKKEFGIYKAVKLED